MHKSKILVVDDDREINHILCSVLQMHGYSADSAYDGVSGLSMALSENSPYQMVILDLMLPYRGGDEVLRQLREKSNIPVIIISAKDHVVKKIELLKEGADDYITKPFNVDEVIARVESTLRRNGFANDDNSVITYGPFVLDKCRKEVALNGTALKLTAKEYCIMELLITNPNQIFSKENLYALVWGKDYFGEDGILNTHMGRIRGKLKDIAADTEYIETVWGLGYRISKSK